MVGQRVAVVGTEGEAEVVCGMLRAAGIKCGWRVTDMSAPLGGRMIFEGWREVLVDPADMERAHELIAATGISN